MKTKQPQPAVGHARGASSAQNTGSQASVASSQRPAEGLAVAPTPPAGVGSAAGGRDDLPRITIDQEGALILAVPRQPVITLRQCDVEALGDFLRLTESLWRP